MKYYRFKKVVTKYTTLSIVSDNDILFYNDTLCGCVQGLDLSIQYPECEVEEVEFEEIKSDLELCRFNKDFNKSIVNGIRQVYSVDEELKITKQAIINPQDKEYLNMQNYIQSVKDVWNIQKRNMGLIQ